MGNKNFVVKIQVGSEKWSVTAVVAGAVWMRAAATGYQMQDAGCRIEQPLVMPSQFKLLISANPRHILARISVFYLPAGRQVRVHSRFFS